MRLAFLFPLLLVAACGGPEEGAEGERKTAAGDVLGGTISDDMLPLDTVTSQSPPLNENAGIDGGDASDAANAPPRDTEGGPGEPPREPAPPATSVPEEAAETEQPAP
jgi:hypothetical protein